VDSATFIEGGGETYSEVHCDLTRRKVIEDLPQPPSPQMVIEILSAIFADGSLCWALVLRLDVVRPEVENEGSAGKRDDI